MMLLSLFWDEECRSGEVAEACIRCERGTSTLLVEYIVYTALTR